MKTISFTKEMLESLQEHPFIEKTFHSEGKILLYQENKEQMALKQLYNDHGFYLGNKLLTLSYLGEIIKELEQANLIVPRKIAIVENNIIGFTMPFVEGPNLSQVLNDPQIDIVQKIKYLKQIGDILTKLKKVRLSKKAADFYLNDVHEGNFVLEEKTDTLKAVDLDSCRIGGNYPFGTKYLSYLTPLKNFPQKYDTNMTRSCGGEFVANENSDLYCYAVIVLNFLFKKNIHVKSIEEYNKYLTYLHTLGASSELIEALSLVYTDSDNINFGYLLDELIEVYPRIRKK